MQVNKISYTNIQTYPARRNAQEQNFQGARLDKLKNSLTPRSQKQYVKGFVEEVGWLLGDHDASLSKYATFHNKKRTALFYNLAEKLNADVFNQKMPTPKDKIAVIDEIYQTIPKPQKVHFSIINNHDYSFEEASKILKLISGNQENTELYTKLRNIKGIAHNRAEISAQSMIDILSSEHAAKLNNNIETYSSYITLNHKKESFAQDLLAELAADKPSFDVEHLNKTVTAKQAKEDSYFLQKFSTDDLLECYNPHGFALINNSAYSCCYLENHKTVLSNDDKEFLKGIIKTTTPENSRHRKLLLQNLKSLNEKEDLARLIEKFDNDKHYGDYMKASKNWAFSKFQKNRSTNSCII